MRNNWSKRENNAIAALYFKAPEGRNGKSDQVLRFSDVYGRDKTAVTWKLGQIEAIVGTNVGADHIQKETIESVKKYAKSHKRHDIFRKIKIFEYEIK